jgi:polyisoprenoid-binding protein YceI
VTVDLEQLSSGGRVRDWNIRRHLDVKKWPRATFEVESVSVVSREPWAANLHGTLGFRDQRKRVSVTATGKRNETNLEVQAEFQLCLPEWGLKPPRFLVFKVDDMVSVHVHLYASARGC